MLAVGKPCTHTSAGAPGVPQRRVKTATSASSFAAVDDRHWISVPPLRQSSKMSIGLGVLGRKQDPGSAEVQLMGGRLESAACRRGLTGPEVTGVAGMAAAGDQHADA